MITDDKLYVDWRQLRQQKSRLVDIRARHTEDSADYNALSGILHMLDNIQDFAAEHVGATAIFGLAADTPRCTSRAITYNYQTVVGSCAVIPKGTLVIPADNLPDKGQYWAEPWDGMDDAAASWMRNYGFLLREDEVEAVSL